MLKKRLSKNGSYSYLIYNEKKITNATQDDKNLFLW